jgi:hypothetical protein
MPSESISSVATIERGKLTAGGPVLPNTSAALARSAEAELAAVSRLPEISDDLMYAAIVERGKSASRIHAALEEDRVSLTKPLLDEKRRIDDAFRPALDAATKAIAQLRTLCGAYLDRKRLERIEVERAAQAEASNAEAERKAALEQQESEARERLKAAAVAGDATAALEAAAEVDEARREAAMPMPAAHAPAAYTEPPKVAGTSRRKKYVWVYANTDTRAAQRTLAVEAVRRFLAGDPSLMPLIEIDESKISTLVRDLGEDCGVPGVVVREASSVAFGRK